MTPPRRPLPDIAHRTHGHPPLVDDGYLVEPEPLDDRIPHHPRHQLLLGSRRRRPISRGCALFGLGLCLGVWLAALLLAVIAVATPRSAPDVIPSPAALGKDPTGGEADLRAPSGAPHDSLPAIQGRGAPHATIVQRSGPGTVDAETGVRLPAVAPQPSADIGTALVGGFATWFDAPGLQAAVSWWQPGPAYPIRVCAGEHCLVVQATGWCACGDRHGVPTIVDLSRPAFEQLAPLGQGIVQVSVEWPVGLPATDGAP